LATTVVHIGLHKTGTTSVQSYFMRYRAELAANGLYYPESGCVTPEGAHHNIYRYYSKAAAESKRFNPKLGGLPELRAELASVDPKSHVLISSEGFWVLARDEPEQFRKFATEIGQQRELMFLVTWRSADEYCESLYFQNAKNRQMPPIEQAIRWFFEFPEEFNRVSRLITDVLGQNLTILQYRRDMVERFRSWFLQSMKLDLNIGTEEIEVNPSMQNHKKIVATLLSQLSQRIDPSTYVTILDTFSDCIESSDTSQSVSIFPTTIQRKLAEKSVSELENLLLRNQRIALFPSELVIGRSTRPYILDDSMSLDFSSLKASFDGLGFEFSLFGQ
jgi:hypothetical protein